MSSVLLLVNDKAFARVCETHGKAPALGTKLPIDTWESKHASLDVLAKGGSLYLLAKRPRNAWWLFGVLGALRKTKPGWTPRVMNTTPIVDITALREPLGLAKLGAAARPLDERTAKMMDQVRIDALHARDFVIAEPPTVDAPAPPPRRYPKLPKLAGELGPACLAQIESVRDDLRTDPKPFLSRAGTFVADVQSIFDGAVDKQEAQRMLRGDLAPFARRDRDVDKVARRAIDELCRGMVALALDREADVPASCATLRRPLARYAAVVETLLAE